MSKNHWVDVLKKKKKSVENFKPFIWLVSKNLRSLKAQ